MMFYQDESQMIFADWMIPSLASFGGTEWQELIQMIDQTPPESIERKAFVLMIARLDSCETCNSDSFRALRGCVRCAEQNITRLREEPKKLLNLYQKALDTVSKDLTQE